MLLTLEPNKCKLTPFKNKVLQQQHKKLSTEGQLNLRPSDFFFFLCAQWIYSSLFRYLVVIDSNVYSAHCTAGLGVADTKLIYVRL